MHSTHRNKYSLSTTLYSVPFLSNFLSLIYTLFRYTGEQDVWYTKPEDQVVKI